MTPRVSDWFKTSEENFTQPRIFEITFRQPDLVYVKVEVLVKGPGYEESEIERYILGKEENWMILDWEIER